ncbi:MAG: response regulator [Planctomycetota bacterium]|jgi:DNA-binding response OmpR family regulator
MAEKKIVWVDDDEDFVLSLQPRLEKEGWEVKTASSAEQGKNMAVTDKPDLIIMDIIMDGQHGYKVIEFLRGHPHLANIPIIVFTSLPDRWGETSATREDFLLSDAAEFVDKSAGTDMLISTIRKHFDT